MRLDMGDSRWFLIFKRFNIFQVNDGRDDITHDFHSSFHAAHPVFALF